MSDIIDPNVIGNEIKNLINPADLQDMYRKVCVNAVKGYNTAIAMNEMDLSHQIPSDILHNYDPNYVYKNKANILYSPNDFTIVNETIPIPDTVLPLPAQGCWQDLLNSRLNSGNTFGLESSITFKHTGYIALWLKLKKSVPLYPNVIGICHLKLGESDGSHGLFIRMYEIEGNRCISVNREIKGENDWNQRENLITIEDLPQIEIPYFINLSWQYSEESPEDKLYLWLNVFYRSTEYPWICHQGTGVTTEMQLDLSSRTYKIETISHQSSDLEWYTGLLFHQNDYRLNKAHQIFALSRHFPVFVEDPIGIDYETTQTIGADPNYIYFVNKNITFEPAQSTLFEDKPGRIIWTDQQNILSSSEYNINEDIKSILPFKSIQPTDEHNTILIWTQDKIHRMAFPSEYPVVIEEMQNISILDKSKFISIPYGCAWIGHEGVWILRQDKITVITKGRVLIEHPQNYRLAYNQENNSIYIITDKDTKTYVYSLDYDAFFELGALKLPDNVSGFMRHRDKTIFATQDDIYEFSDTDLAAKIEFQNINMLQQKIIRFVDDTLTGKHITSFKARCFNQNGEYVDTPDIAIMLTNIFYQVPGLIGTPVQITIEPTSAITALEVYDK